MYRFLQIANWLALVLLAFSLAAGGYSVRQVLQGQIITLTEQQHVGLLQSYNNSVWKNYRDKVLTALAGDLSELADNVDIAMFAQDTTAFFTSTPPLRVNIYSAQKSLLMTLNGTTGTALSVAGASVDMQNVNQGATSNKPFSALVSAVKTSSDEISVVQTVMPIKTAAGQVEIIVEMVSDVDASLSSTTQLQIICAVALLVGVLMLFALYHFNRKRAEDIIAKQYDENSELVTQASAAKEANQQKSQFLANITHELRTPLNAIIGFSDILKNEFVPAPGQSKHSDYINDIHSSGVHLLSLINDILDYSKAEANKLELDVSEVNAIKMVQNCVRLIMPRAEIGQVKVVESLPKDVMTMITDGKKFKQIILNLLSNAVKFTPPDGTVKISAWHDINEDMCVFEVKDTGIGIAPKDISRAMSPFGQVENSMTRKFEGTGLGLPITQKFVELMGGKFSIESALNKGTTVTFSLPKEVKAHDGVTVKHIA